MNKRGFCALALGAALAFAWNGAAFADDTLAKVKAAGVMKVGTETEFAPFDYIDAGQHVGLNVDLFDEIGKELGVKIEWVTLPWDGVLPGLEAGKFDIVAGPATITKARMEHYRVLPADRRGDGGADEARGRQVDHEAGGHRRQGGGRRQGDRAARAVAVVRLETAGRRADEGICRLQRGLCRSRRRPHRRRRQFAAQHRLRRQAAPDTFAVVLPTFGVKTYFGFIGRKGDDDKSLMNAIDAALVKMKNDGRMAKLQQKWFGVSFDTPDAVPTPNI